MFNINKYEEMILKRNNLEKTWNFGLILTFLLTLPTKQGTNEYKALL